VGAPATARITEPVRKRQADQRRRSHTGDSSVPKGSPRHRPPTQRRSGGRARARTDQVLPEQMKSA
jgi:hypothetical protein